MTETTYYTGEIVTDPKEAADLIAQGYVVDYQPGDGTRYECEIALGHAGLNPYPSARRYLVIRNLGGMLDLSREWMGASYCTTATAPVGSWYALRPVLAGLGCAKGEPVLTPFDQRHESDLRAHDYDEEPLDHADARLGRKVRRLIEEEQGRTPTPVEPPDPDTLDRLRELVAHAGPDAKVRVQVDSGNFTTVPVAVLVSMLRRA